MLVKAGVVFLQLQLGTIWQDCNGLMMVERVGGWHALVIVLDWKIGRNVAWSNE